LGAQEWHEDPGHGLVFLLARFFIVWLVAAVVGSAAGFLALHFIFKK
jgi:hypothetical protein